MAHFHIEGLHPYDGDYPVDSGTFTNRELHIIKEISGVRAGELQEAFMAGDSDLIVAFLEIVLRRAGHMVLRDRLWDAPAGSIEFVVDDEADGDAGPPERQPLTSGGASATISDSTETSGRPGSNDGAARLASVPNSTGVPA